MAPPRSDSGSGESLTKEELEFLLSSEPRRATVEHLLEEGAASREELVTTVGKEVTNMLMTDHDRVRIAVSLAVDHLPPLAEAGLITVNEETVSLTFLPEQTYDRIEQILDSHAND